MNSMLKKQSGAVLIVGLIFILIISLATISSMQETNLNYKISTNESFKNISFQSSESGRAVSGDALSYYIYHRSWDAFNVAGLSWTTLYDPSTDSLDPLTENLYDTSSLGVDMNFTLSGTGVEVASSNISIAKSPGVKSTGSAFQQLSGYEGLGKGAGAGGIHLIYEVRSTGLSAGNAVTVTASEYRVVP